MKTSSKLSALPRLSLAAALAAVVVTAGAASPEGDEAFVVRGVGAENTLHETGAELAKSVEVNERGIYIVGLRSAPLAMYDGTVKGARYPAIPRAKNGRLDLRSEAAERYLGALTAEQDLFLNRVGARLARPVEAMAPHLRFQHAFNGFVLKLSPEELKIVASDPDVALIEGYREYELNTDVGPSFIGAPAIWEGIGTPNGFRSRGEGMVIGVIDSGANLGSPSFTATDMEGYTHTNPLGDGNYLGWCNPTNPNHNPARDICNSKVIGGWDFSDNQITGTNREATGFEDENGHGSHTAATAGGNVRTASIGGANVIIEGVAPRANLVIYDACYTVADGRGLCGNDATLASINQAVADGVVDVINYSISGGAQPWLEANSLAFLAAHNAGIFVSASAGNSGPAASTVAHNEPWVTTVAASTHTRVAFGNKFSFSGPGTPPANTIDLPTRPGVNPPLTNTFPLDNVPLIVSPTFSTPASDGCSAFPAGTFVRNTTVGEDIFASSFEADEVAVPVPQQGAIALLRFPAGTSACGPIARANAAAAAGARAVVFVPEAPFNLNAAGGAQVPVFVLYEFNTHQPLLDAIAANAAAAVGTIDPQRVAFTNPNAGDVMGDFSSRGPNIFPFLKPDVTAPGVSILAAVSRWNRATAPGTLDTSLNNAVGLLQGTSMSSPHNAGAGALVRAVNRNWTPSEVKSALMTTSIQAVRKENGTTPADPFDYGAGRINLNRAALAGLVMNETGANFAAANPGTGGDPSQLNIPSFQRPTCVGVCTFNRNVRATRTGVTWTATIEGLPAGSATVSPATLTPTSTTSTSAFALAVDSAQLPPNAWTFGQVVWTPSNPNVPVARMPIAIRASGPQLQVPQASISAIVEPNSTAVRQITVNNGGNPTLSWSIGTGSNPLTFMEQIPQLGNGFRGSQHAASEPNTGYAADDFDLAAPGTVTFLQSNGFVLPGGATLANATALLFRIYADDNGVPAGAPRFNGTTVGAAPVWEASVLPNAAGVSIAAGGVNGNISLDLAAAGLTPPALPAGKYWLVVTPNLPGTGAGAAPNSLWAAAIVGVGAPVNGLAPRARASTVGSTWNIPTLTGAPGPGPASGFSMIARGTIQCGAPWLSASPASGSLGLAGSNTVNVTLDSTGLSPGIYRAALCVTSNVGNRALPVTMTVPTTDPNPTVQVGFSPSTISTAATSRLTLTLGNTSGGTMTTTAPFTDSFPAGLVVAATPNATTTCSSGSVTAVAGEGQLQLAAGAQIPAAGTCTVAVNVGSAVAGSYANDIPAGSLQTTSAAGAGSNQLAATATLAVNAPVFPEPYCPINFTTSVDPISLVRYAGIDNSSPSATGTPPALSNFLNVQGTVTRNASAPITVKGNTDGDFPYQVIAYIDWNQNGVFDAAEATIVGVIQNSTGADALEAVGSISVPATALTGSTRMRVVFQNPTVAGPCTGGGFGSAEDYTIVVN
jgi:hypothetical protein